MEEAGRKVDQKVCELYLYLINTKSILFLFFITFQ